MSAALVNSATSGGAFPCRLAYAINAKVPNSELLEQIGHTPVVRLRHSELGPCELYVKLEQHNPGGSIKDRIALAMIEAAEADGTLEPGGIVVEATSGNTGISLALVSALRGYHFIAVVPDKTSQEKMTHLRALARELIVTRSDVKKGHPEYYHDVAARVAAEKSGIFLNQYRHPANPRAHEATTAVELWEQMEHRLDAVVVGAGSGGTLTGLSRFFAKHAPHVEMILADPVGSVYATYFETGRVIEAGHWLIEGVGKDFIPPNCDFSAVKRAYQIPDRESLRTVRELLRDEGILAGMSSGMMVAAARRYCRAQDRPKRVATFISDSGDKYLSKVFNDAWLKEKGVADK